MRLKKLFANLNNIPDLEIKGINTDSNLISAGEIFVAIKGAEQDGHKFIKDAVKNGAVCVVKERSSPTPKDLGLKKTVIINVSDTRKEISQLAAKFYNYPSRKLRVIGVTGTNGKTTIAYLVESILEEAGYPTGLLGTINYKFKKHVLPSINTTPGALEMQAFLAKMVKEKLRYCVMEASSHSLEQERVRDVDFHIAIFTNLTQDHLDYHHNLEDYFRAKSKLFTNLDSESYAVVNIEDPYSARLLKLTKARKITFGFSEKSQIRATNIRLSIKGSDFQILTSKGSFSIQTELIGRHNIYNILSAVSVGVIEGIDFSTIKRGIEKIDCVAGRLEAINQGQKFGVFVDYAHTEDALKNVISSLKEFHKGKIIVVFGCGGQRDTTKRPKMGRLVSQMADYFIITNDNPRKEDPQKIVKDILKGIKTKNYDVILDRGKAIEKAIKMAGDNDTVLIAGKGHETSQILKNKSLAFDDREVTRRILNCLS